MNNGELFKDVSRLDYPLKVPLWMLFAELIGIEVRIEARENEIKTLEVV